MINLKKKSNKAIAIITAAILSIIIACGVYLGDYYHANSNAISAFATVNNINKITNKNFVAFEPQNPTAGLIFYPGGKVEHTAYEPLMKSCADRGILCILIEMPFNLAVFDINAADGIKEQYPQIQNWYIGGHSLGGSMAATYLEKNAEDFDGLILLGSYSTADLSHSNLEVLSIFGSEDWVLDIEKYSENRANLPEKYTEETILGGCHAYFGTYGAQDGDGIPTISNEEQIRITADSIEEFVK